ncbi:hypothetical protein EVAR_18584_1 [Eumeta japonica]|uniref:Uncharacterized protein n=1 Tax=Eumeta variegata TaxID=151549 RepID=A0A4C1V519_EUMVA|nr:hypothetical protein EVAR_18584_1 [Eumeta japonica]
MLLVMIILRSEHEGFNRYEDLTRLSEPRSGPSAISEEGEPLLQPGRRPSTRIAIAVCLFERRGSRFDALSGQVHRLTSRWWKACSKTFPNSI